MAVHTESSTPDDTPAPVGLGYAPSEPRRSLFARLMAARGVWALGDQAICSAGNFFAGLLMARGLEKDPNGFGVYSLTFSVLLFLNSLHGAVITYPLTLEGAGAAPRRFRQLTRRGIQFTLSIGPVLAIVILAAALRMDRMSLLPWTILAMVVWQAQETVRRALLAKLRHRDAIPGDVIRFVGQAVAIYVLYRMGILSPEWAMASIAITSGLALVLQTAQVMWSERTPVSERTREYQDSCEKSVRDDAVHWWRSGRWLLVTCLVNVGTIYIAPWFLEAVQGERAVGELAALNALLNLTNPVLFSLAGLVVAAVAAARAAAPTPLDGVMAGRRVAMKYSVMGLCLVLPYYAIVALFPEFMLSLFFKPTSPYVALAGEVKWMTLIYAVMFISAMAVSLLNGLGQARASFIATLSSSLATVAISLPLILKYGLHGALVGGSIPMLIQLGIAIVLLRRHTQLAASQSVGPSATSAEVVSANDDAPVIVTGGPR